MVDVDQAKGPMIDIDQAKGPKVDVDIDQAKGPKVDVDVDQAKGIKIGGIDQAKGPKIGGVVRRPEVAAPVMDGQGFGQHGLEKGDEKDRNYIQRPGGVVDGMSSMKGSKDANGSMFRKNRNNVE